MGGMEDIAKLCAGACANVGGVLVALMSILNLSIGAAVSCNSSLVFSNNDAMKYINTPLHWYIIHLNTHFPHFSTKMTAILPFHNISWQGED